MALYLGSAGAERKPLFWSWPDLFRPPTPCLLAVQIDVDARDIQREDARSLSSGRALRGPVGAFARGMTNEESADAFY
jgi:hypothetical protein